MLEVYKNFELVTMAPVFTELVWRRRFSMAGEFQLTTNFTGEAFEIFGQGNILYKRNVDEAAFIESRNVIQSIDGELRLIVRGRFLPSLLDRRVVNLEWVSTPPIIVEHIINSNFLQGAGSLRSMAPGLRLLPVPNFNGTRIAVEYRNRNAYDIITTLLQEHNAGLKGRYNFDNNTMDISFYEPVQTDVTFSKEFANIIEQDYRDDIERYRNVVFVEYNSGIFIHNNNAHTGLDRREIAVRARADTASGLMVSAWDAINENRAVKTLSSIVNPFNRQFEYLKDWNVGSVVLSENRAIGFLSREVITEVTEYYDRSGMNLEVNLGSYITRR